jgi:hypothetical protein
MTVLTVSLTQVKSVLSVLKTNILLDQKLLLLFSTVGLRYVRESNPYVSPFCFVSEATLFIIVRPPFYSRNYPILARCVIWSGCALPQVDGYHKSQFGAARTKDEVFHPLQEHPKYRSGNFKIYIFFTCN